jgi:hypothetical protein
MHSKVGALRSVARASSAILVVGAALASPAAAQIGPVAQIRERPEFVVKEPVNPRCGKLTNCGGSVIVDPSPFDRCLPICKRPPGGGVINPGSGGGGGGGGGGSPGAQGGEPGGPPVSAPNRPPSVSLAFAPQEPQAGEPVIFAGVAADPDGAVQGITWTFGDGTVSSEISPRHAFPTAGSFTVTLTATDNLGLPGSIARAITISRPDHDRDGFAKPADCDDDNPRVRPRAREIGGNTVDENCDGILASETRLPKLQVQVDHFWQAFSQFTTVVNLMVRPVPKGARVEVRCRGAGCDFRRRLRAVKSSARGRQGVALQDAFRDDRLGVGARVEVRVTKRNTIGRVVTFRMRSRRLPALASKCLAPGVRRATSC